MDRAVAVPAAGAGSAARLLFAALAGAALALAQPPMSFPWVFFVALPILFWLTAGTATAWRAAGIGWVAGTAFFAAALFWIVEPFQVDPDMHGWLAPFALVGMAGGLSLFWAASFGLSRAVGAGGLRGALAFGGLFAAAEVARSYVLTGFPWALLGYGWVETPVMQVVSLIGVQGLSLLTLLVALLPAGASTLNGRVVAGLGSIVLLGTAWFWGSERLAQPALERDEPYVVRLVQPNAPQHLKWQPQMQQLFYERHLRLTAAAPGSIGAPDVVVWSETAVPFILEFADDYLAQIAEIAGVPVILGIMRVEVEPDAERWFNALAVIGENGRPKAIYDKHHLVPFGEYIPLQQVVRRLGGPTIETLTRGGFIPGDGPHLVGAPGVPPFLPLICYEAIFARHMWAPEGRPEWIVQVTNDAWFGTLSGPYQHYAQNRVRAIEQGLPLVRVANTGISAMIDPFGREIARIGLGEEGFVDAELPGALPPTFYAQVGERPVLIVIVLLCMLTLINLQHGKFRFLRP